MKAADEKNAVAMENEVRDFVWQRVQGVSLETDLLSLNWNGSEGEQLIESLFTEAYDILEID